MRANFTVLVLILVTLEACGKQAETAKTPVDSAAANMGGMQMGTARQGVEMMPSMRSHLDSIASMQPAQMTAMMPGHQDLTTRMIDAMGSDMRGANMQPDAGWTALADSAGRDLEEMRGLSGDALRTRMQAHVARMQRLMQKHEGMMRM